MSAGTTLVRGSTHVSGRKCIGPFLPVPRWRQGLEGSRRGRAAAPLVTLAREHGGSSSCGTGAGAGKGGSGGARPKGGAGGDRPSSGHNHAHADQRRSGPRAAHAQRRRARRGAVAFGGHQQREQRHLLLRFGWRSSVAFFFAKVLLGWPNVRNYDGGWLEWSDLHPNAAAHAVIGPVPAAGGSAPGGAPGGAMDDTDGAKGDTGGAECAVTSGLANGLDTKDPPVPAE